MKLLLIIYHISIQKINKHFLHSFAISLKKKRI